MRLYFIGFLYFLFLLVYSVNSLSFSIVDVEGIEHFLPLKYIVDFNILVFGKNDFAIRFPQLLIGFLSFILFTKIARLHFKRDKDYLLVSLFILIFPGFIISSLIVNKSIYIVFAVLLFIYSFYKKRLFSYFLLFLYAFLDRSFIALYFSLIFYAIYKKDNILLTISIILLAINANYFNYYEYVDKKPRGYFLDIFGVYMLIFSPFVFIYFLYSLYKSWFFKKDIIFFISFFTFLLSIILSFRQKVKIYDYAPFTLPFIIYMFKTFLSSYRVRLPMFRREYKVLFVLLLGSVMLFDILFFFSPFTPLKRDSILFTKQLAIFLKEHNIKRVNLNNSSLQKALAFYGIKKGNVEVIYKKREGKIVIKKKNLVIDVSKLNT